MPYSYTIDGRIVRVAWHGVVAKEDLESFGAAMPQVGRSLGFAPDVLHTFDGVTGHSFQPIAAYLYSLLQKRERIPNPVRAAIIATDRQGMALAKVFTTLNRTRNLEMRIFADEPSARSWLEQK